jgi:hypothetical protein
MEKMVLSELLSASSAQIQVLASFGSIPNGMVGTSSDGASDGTREGTSEGTSDGVSDGNTEEDETDGVIECSSEGAADGRKVIGIADGKTEGVLDGRNEGVSEGQVEVLEGNSDSVIEFQGVGWEVGNDDDDGSCETVGTEDGSIAGFGEGVLDWKALVVGVGLANGAREPTRPKKSAVGDSSSKFSLEFWSSKFSLDFPLFPFLVRRRPCCESSLLESTERASALAMMANNAKSKDHRGGCTIILISTERFK